MYIPWPVKQSVLKKFRALAYAVGGSDYFSPRERTAAHIDKYRRIYEQGGLVSQAINCYPEYMFMNVLDSGFELTGENERQREFVLDTIEKLNFLDVAWQQVLNSLIEGSGIMRVVRTRGKGIYNLIPDDSALYSADVDKTGQITRYYRKDPGQFTRGTPVDPKDIYKVDVLHGFPFGRSLVGIAFDDIIRDTKIAEGVANGIERHGTPKYDIVVGNDDQEVSDDDLRALAQKFNKLNSKHEIIHRSDVQISELDTAGIKVNNPEASIDRLCAALGVPNELLGQGRGSTEATANVRMRSFQNKIKAMQSRFNYQTFHQLFRPLLEAEFGSADPVYIQFGDIVPEDLATKADALSKLMPQLDPFLLLTRDEIREELGRGPYEDEE
jgi:hypothetical protein